MRVEPLSDPWNLKESGVGEQKTTVVTVDEGCYRHLVAVGALETRHYLYGQVPVIVGVGDSTQPTRDATCFVGSPVPEGSLGYSDRTPVSPWSPTEGEDPRSRPPSATTREPKHPEQELEGVKGLR